MESSRNSQITLLVFGDSWPAGAELNDRTHAFPYLLAKMKNMHIENLSVPGTSIDHATLTLMDFFEKDYDKNQEYRILFCITDPSRYMAFKDSGRTKRILVNNQHEIDQKFYRYLHGPDWEEFQLRRNLVLVQALCSVRGIKSYFVCNWHMPHDVAKYVDNVFDTVLADIAGWDNLCPMGHPDSQGHSLIAEKLRDWLY